MSEAISDVRKRSWETRRQRYGAKGHNSSYVRPPGPCSCCAGLLPLVIRLHREGVLSEGQVAKASGLDRIEVRRLADEQAIAAAPAEACRSMPILIPCPTCSGTQTVTHEDRHAETRQDVCLECAPYADVHPGRVPAMTGETREAAFDPANPSS